MRVILEVGKGQNVGLLYMGRYDNNPKFRLI